MSVAESFSTCDSSITQDNFDTVALEKTRRDIARIETVLREVERAQVTGA